MNKQNPKKDIKKLVSTRNATIKDVIHETTSGGIVYRLDKDKKVEVLLIQDAKNRWTIPKGHVEPGEEPRQTAEREIQEETGLQDMEVLSWLGKVNFRYRRISTLVLMTMHVYLVKAKGNTDNLKPEEWLNGIKWFQVNDAIDNMEYEDINKLMLLGFRKIRESR
ncbi:MAG: NUDIX domain-containing protein [bacterium]|jgi:8-oxo-dGTP pyrophosphatase MutT (NUDIX family)